MEKKKTIFDFLGSLFMIYGITVVMLMTISFVFGSEENMMFALGSKGLTMTLLLEFLLLSLINVILQYLCFSERIIKEGSHKFRTLVMFISILIIMAIFIHLFGWFPENYILPWVMYVVFFLVSAFVSLLIISWKEKLENKQMEEGLKRIKSKLKEEKGV